LAIAAVVLVVSLRAIAASSGTFLAKYAISCMARRKRGVQHIRSVSCLAVGLCVLASSASAQDILRLAVAQRGAWESAAPELGQLAGTFKNHGIVLDLVYPSDGDAELPVIAGTADVGLAIGLMRVLRVYAKGAPVRIIGAIRTGSAGYWYVPATSPIKTVKDLNGKTIAYPTGGELSRYSVFDLMDQYRIRARPMPAPGAAAMLDEVMSGHIDVGWATPPFGIDAIEEDQIRVVARANDVSKVRDKTAQVMIANADTLRNRKDVLARFMEGYRETLEWMYAGPAALKSYADLAGMSESHARRLRDEFLPKSMLSPDKIFGFDAVVKDARALRYIQAPLSKSQVTELIQILPVKGAAPAQGIGQWFRLLAPR
jgi:NitT/TauT family transport system substrate-binding protein